MMKNSTFISLLCLSSTSFSHGTKNFSYDHAATSPPEAFASRSYFYVGGHYANVTLPGANSSAQYMTGQIYVERLMPESQEHKTPIVFISGNGQTGANWLNTPDDREGWASYFLRQGHTVYLTDQAQRGRSPWLPGDGSYTTFSTATEIQQFTAAESRDPLPYPQAALHTQWPGSGRAGDPIFDAFYASQVPTQANSTLLARYNNASYVALLDRIAEPVVVVTHSQSGPYGFQLADARPGLVRGLLSMEPQGPPFENWVGAPFTPGYQSPSRDRTYGVSGLPLHYDPPVGDDASLLVREVVPAANANESACFRQAEPARKLINLATVPVLVLTGEASYHRVYDHCTVAYLKQADVPVEHIQLGDVDIHGNSHFLFLEKNNLQIASEVVAPWIEKLVASPGPGRVLAYRQALVRP